MSYPRYFVDGISKIDPDTKNGIVKLTFSVNNSSKVEDVVQLVIPVDSLNQAFQSVGETMSKTFGQGGAGRPSGARTQGRAGPSFKDLTEK